MERYGPQIEKYWSSSSQKLSPGFSWITKDNEM